MEKIKSEKRQDACRIMAGMWSDAVRPFVKEGGEVADTDASLEDKRFLQLVRRPQHKKLWRAIVHQLAVNEANA